MNGSADPSHQTAMGGLRLYMGRQADGFWRYWLEQMVYLLFGWIPSVLGIGIRSIVYKVVMHIQGVAAIESGVRLRFANHITLERGVYLDQGTYLHACPAGIHLGENTIVMHGAILHVYNFRDLPHAGIHIGRDSLVGEYSVIRGQGGVTIGDRVYTSPFTQIIAVNHVFSDPELPFTEQGITAEGIVIEDDVWLGSGVVVLDGVHIGKGSVIAAGAVVNKDIPAHVVAAGVPARVIKQITKDDQQTTGKAVFF